MNGISDVPTPYRLRCNSAYGCGSAYYLTEEEYNRQMIDCNSVWKCPECGYPAEFDDSNYESFYGLRAY